MSFLDAWLGRSFGLPVGVCGALCVFELAFWVVVVGAISADDRSVGGFCGVCMVQRRVMGRTGIGCPVRRQPSIIVSEAMVSGHDSLEVVKVGIFMQ